MTLLWRQPTCWQMNSTFFLVVVVIKGKIIAFRSSFFLSTNFHFANCTNDFIDHLICLQSFTPVPFVQGQNSLTGPGISRIWFVLFFNRGRRSTGIPGMLYMLLSRMNKSFPWKWRWKERVRCCWFPPLCIFLVEVGTPAALKKYIFTHTQRDSSRHTMKGACHERYFILIPPTELKRIINISTGKRKRGG